MKIEKISLNSEGIKKFLKTSLSAGLVPYVKGSPGIGKSDVAQAIAKELDLKLIDVRLSQCDPTDLNGFPSVNAEGRSTYKPMTTWPLVGDALPFKYNPDGSPVLVEGVHQQYKGWFIFFDELSSASPAVQSASYKILLDRKVGDFDLHPAVKMAAAGNLATDNAVVEDMSTALQSRLIHATMRVDDKAWLKWATLNGVDPRIISYISWKPASLYNFQPDHEGDTFACPRTWKFASDLLTKGNLDMSPNGDAVFSRAMLTGTLSEATAREFIAYCNYFSKLPSIEEIIANPMGVPVPEEIGVLYAMTSSIASGLTEENCEQLFKFLGRMDIEYQIIAMRTAIPRNRNIARQKAVTDWCQKNAGSLF